MSDGNRIVEYATGKVEKIDNAWLRGGLQAVPYVGGTIDTWLFQFAEKAKQKRVQDALEELRQRVGALEIDVSKVDGRIEEFGYIAERTIILIAQDYRSEMRSAYAKMLANFMSSGFSELDNKELYLQYLSGMSPAHLLALAEFKRLLGDKGEVKVQPDQSVQQVISGLVSGGVEQVLAESLLNDLVTRGMVAHMQSSVIGGDTHRYTITDLGERMLELVA
jgi:hypothetical protein